MLVDKFNRDRIVEELKHELARVYELTGVVAPVVKGNNNGINYKPYKFHKSVFSNNRYSAEAASGSNEKTYSDKYAKHADEIYKNIKMLETYASKDELAENFVVLTEQVVDQIRTLFNTFRIHINNEKKYARNGAAAGNVSLQSYIWDKPREEAAIARFEQKTKTNALEIEDLQAKLEQEEQELQYNKGANSEALDGYHKRILGIRKKIGALNQDSTYCRERIENIKRFLRDKRR